jgi:AcrR family transcriptional regulator
MDQEKRIKIIHKAMKLFNENGFHATPTSLIAKKANVSVGTLFNYFSTKEDLIESIYVYIKSHSKMTFLKLLEEKEDLHDTLLSMWKAIITWGVQNPDEFNYLELFWHSPFREHFQGEKSLEAYKQFQLKLISIVAPETICKEYPNYILDFIDSSLRSAIRYLLENKVVNKDYFIKNAFDLLWKGLSQN